MAPLVPFIVPALAVASTGVSIAGAAGAFGGAPDIPEPPDRSAEEAQQAAREQRIRAARASGRRNTLLTGGLGVEEPAQVKTKTLLGQ